MNTHNVTAMPAIALLSILLAACTTMRPPVESITLYTFAVQPLQPVAAPKLAAVVEVASPIAWPGFDTPGIVYVREPYELDYFAASRWADTPAHMLNPLIVRALEQTGVFRAVVRAHAGVPADFRLDTEIVRLVQDFDVRPSRVEIALRARLTDLRARRVAASGEFDEIETASAENAAGGVVATNVALQRMLQRIAEWCVVSLSTR